MGAFTEGIVEVLDLIRSPQSTQDIATVQFYSSGSGELRPQIRFVTGVVDFLVPQSTAV